ncbi:MAG: hypothetical protein ACREQ9_18380 [Candidatus Binatia bacterium]
MNRRLKTLLLGAIFAASTAMIGAAPAAADPPPWSAAYHKHNGKHCNHPSHRNDRARYDYDRYDSRRYDGYRYGGGADRCAPIIARAEKAREGLRRWSGTGRHEDAQRAWREVLSRTPQRLRECQLANRNGGGRYYPGSYGGYDEPYYDDPYYGGSVGAGFELKRDWPLLLGPLLGQFGNQ